MGKGSYGFPGLKNVNNGNATHSISSNLKSIGNNYGLSNSGYVAQKSYGNNSSNRRTFFSNDPVGSAKKLFRTLGRGGIQKIIKSKDGSVKGWIRIMKGGDVITYRPRQSSDSSPVIDINIISRYCGIKSQKIHFYKKGDKNEK